MNPFKPKTIFHDLLDRQNQRREKRLKVFHTYSGCHPWHPGVVITQDMRTEYEKFFPVNDMLADLVVLGNKVLPDSSWLPLCLRHYPIFADAPINPFMSLPDFWAVLPDRFAARVSYTADEIPALFCALADPERFGTNTERYPEQMAALKSTLEKYSLPKVLDLGCGVGHGTYEIANLASGPVDITGVTIEKLEVWMAENRFLPHSQYRTDMFPECNLEKNVSFLPGNVLACPLDETFDVIVCNGLAGGRFLCKTADLQQFVYELKRLSHTGTCIFMANHFHAGYDKSLEKLMQLAQENGFMVEGNLRNAVLVSC